MFELLVLFGALIGFMALLGAVIMIIATSFGEE